MHTKDLDLNAIRQLILLLKADVSRIQKHINQTPETHLGEVAQDPNWTAPASS